MIGKNEFSMMQKNATIINTARGDIIDVSELVIAIEQGKIRAAGIDVLPFETILREETAISLRHINKSIKRKTLLANQRLFQMRNVVITPHSAFYTKEAIERITIATISNIDQFIRGTPTNII